MYCIVISFVVVSYRSKKCNVCVHVTCGIRWDAVCGSGQYWWQVHCKLGPVEKFVV